MANINLSKSPAENNREFIWRLCFAKDTGALQMDWAQLANILNKEIYGDDIDSYVSPSAFRKPYQAARAFYEDVFLRQSSNAYADEIQEKIRELEKVKKQIQTEKVEYNRWLREDARDDLLLEKIIEAVKEDNDMKPVVELPAPILGDKTRILLFGDAHFGAEFEIKGLHGETLNKYTPEIFYKRMDRLLAEVIEIINKEDLGELYVFDLGDGIDGILRVSQLFKLRYGVVESSIRYAKYLSNWLNELSTHVKVQFRSINGNHSELRMLNQPKGSFVNDNMGYIINEIIKARLMYNPNVIIKDNPTGMIYENIQGYNILGYHGEHKKLGEALKSFSQVYGVDIDLLVGAHLHRSYSETVAFGTDVMRTPSIIGVDDFSIKLLKTSEPGATMITMQRGKGKTDEHYFKLGGDN